MMQTNAATERPETVEPGVIRLNGVQEALIDQLVEKRLSLRGGDARTARHEVVRDVLAEGLMAVQAREGMA